MADAPGSISTADEEDEPRTALDDLDELLQDIAFEAANRLDWVTIVRQGFPALSEEQEQTLKDMGEAFAADQIVQREWMAWRRAPATGAGWRRSPIAWRLATSWTSRPPPSSCSAADRSGPPAFPGPAALRARPGRREGRLNDV